MKFTEEIKIKNGIIKGEYLHDRIATFKGIPYAKAPAGELRFKKTEKAESFDGVKTCVEFGASPIQKPMVDNPMWTKEFIVSNQNLSEDSLTLNLWTNFEKKNMPVIIYFYGGGLVGGGSSCEIYDGTTLAENGVIYVTFNHREGVLGLFEGNNLLYDGIEVIKWVRENIVTFGGDPNNITIMGQSSGAIEVNALATSKLTKGLIKRVIAMSFNSYINFGKTYMTKEELKSEDDRVMSMLKKTRAEMNTCDASEFMLDKTINRLTIDGEIIEKRFKDLIDDGRTNDLIYVMGSVAGDNILQGICAEVFMGGNPPVSTKEELIELCKKFFKDKYDEFAKLYNIDSREFNDVKKEIDEDFLIASMLLFKNARKKAGSDKTYIYYYTHPLPGPMKEKFGAFHSAEVPYFFNVFSDFRKEYWKGEDKALGKYLSSELSNFVKNDVVSDIEKVPLDEYSYFRIDAKEKSAKAFSENKYLLFEYGFERRSS